MTTHQRLLTTAFVLVALAATAGCNKRDNVPPVNPSSPTAPTVPAPETSASAPMPGASQ